MKLVTLALSVLLASPAAFAVTPKEVVQKVQAAYGLICQNTGSSAYEYCLNYTCQYKSYYACSNESEQKTLIMKIRSYRFPGEVVENTVVDYSLN
jgi:hypothetical protein